MEVPLTSMLDVAFQLLAFFVMTFNPTPVEVQYTMNLLPGSPQALPEQTNSEESTSNSSEIPAALRTLTTSLIADVSGKIERITIGENEVQGIDQLRARLKTILSDKTLPFDQALIQADPNLQYAELMAVIDVFSGEGLQKISFAELNSNGLGPSL